MLKDEYKVYEEKMKKSIESVMSDFDTVRAGRANASVLNRISVDYYGTPTPIQQIGSIGSPDPRTLVITPWDASILKGIEKAIQESDLGINPQNDGKCIRLAFPQLTEERRKELVKQIHKYAENGKVAVDLFERSAPGEYAAILMDIQMPIMDGLDAARTIRALPREDAASIPIFALSASVFTEDVERSLCSGMNGHLGKPVDIDQICSMLQTWLYPQQTDTQEQA